MEAIVKQTNGAYVIIPSTPAGLLTGEQLAKIAELVNQGAGLAKLTTAQRIGIVTTEDKIESVRQGLESAGLKIGPVGNVVRNVKGCAGALCFKSNQDALKHAVELDSKVSGQETPFAFKISLSGCGNNCMEVRSADLGFLGTPKGYKVYIGGRGGGQQQLGELIAEEVQPEELESWAKHVIEIYKKEAKPKERLCSLIKRIGLTPFKKQQ